MSPPSVFDMNGLVTCSPPWKCTDRPHVRPDGLLAPHALRASSRVSLLKPAQRGSRCDPRSTCPSPPTTRLARRRCLRELAAGAPCQPPRTRWQRRSRDTFSPGARALAERALGRARSPRAAEVYLLTEQIAQRSSFATAMPSHAPPSSVLFSSRNGVLCLVVVHWL